MYIVHMSAFIGDHIDGRICDFAHSMDTLHELKDWCLAFIRACENAGWRQHEGAEGTVPADEAQFNLRLRSVGLKRSVIFSDARNPYKHVTVSVNPRPLCGMTAEQAAARLLR